MPDFLARTRLLLGEEALQRLAAAHVAVFGLGGVGGYVVEALARSGIGALTLVDNDIVDATNLNRQLIATTRTLGRPKVEAMRERVEEIAPACRVVARRLFYLPETREAFDFTTFDYVVDAIDTVAGKLSLAEEAYRLGTPIISSMGAGNKLDPTAFAVADIYETSVCPLARVMRRELKKRGVERLKVVYSKEPPLSPLAESAGETETDAAQPADGQRTGSRRRAIPGSVAFVPSVAGLIAAGEVVKDIAAG